MAKKMKHEDTDMPPSKRADTAGPGSALDGESAYRCSCCKNTVQARKPKGLGSNSQQGSGCFRAFSPASHPIPQQSVFHSSTETSNDSDRGVLGASEGFITKSKV